MTKSELMKLANELMERGLAYDRICAGGYEWENINDSAEGLELYNEIVENHTPIDYCIVKLTTSKE